MRTNLLKKIKSDGKRIALAMTVFIFFPLVSRAPFLIASPLPTTYWTSSESNNIAYTNNTVYTNSTVYNNNTMYNKWAAETGDRLQTVSISLLLVGSLTFVSVICLFLFEDKWVGIIVSKFPKHSAPEISIRGRLNS